MAGGLDSSALVRDAAWLESLSAWVKDAVWLEAFSAWVRDAVWELEIGNEE